MDATATRTRCPTPSAATLSSILHTICAVFAPLLRHLAGIDDPAHAPAIERIREILAEIEQLHALLDACAQEPPATPPYLSIHPKARSNAALRRARTSLLAPRTSTSKRPGAHDDRPLGGHAHPASRAPPQPG